MSAAAGAQEYPTKPITLIVPWPAGGSTDISMRAIADSASKMLGQPIAIDNKAGGGGTVGPATMAAAAKPDGYTIAQIPITVFRLPLMQEVSWDPAKDFTYIVHLTGYTFGVTTSAESPFKTWQDVIDFAKQNPGKVTYATPGTGTSLHIGMEQIAGDGRHQADAGAVQGRRGNQRRGARPAHHAAGGFDRLAAAGRRRQAAAADGVDLGALAELSGCADAEGTRLSHGLRLTVRHRRTEGHGSEDRRQAARRLQEGARRIRP